MGEQPLAKLFFSEKLPEAVVVPEDLHTVLPVVEREKLFQSSLMKKVSDSSPIFSENTKLPMLNNLSQDFVTSIVFLFHQSKKRFILEPNNLRTYQTNLS